MNDCRNIKNRNGFTLAEVLITLGIIGVVASITIPILQKDIQDSESKSAFMKEYSTAQNAFRKAAQDNGGSLVGYSILTGNTHDRSNELKDFIKPYLSYVKECNRDKIAQCSPVKKYTTYTNESFPAGWIKMDSPASYPQAVLMLNDGSIWYFFAYYDEHGTCTSQWATTNNSCGAMYIDTNGAKKPNQAGYDLFQFHIVADGSIIPMGTQNDKFENGYSKEIGFNPRANYMLGISK